MSSWLQRQRKQALLDLSTEAGLEQDEDLRKDDIVEALDNYLKMNATRLSRNSTFEPYYGTRSRTPYRTSSAAAPDASDDAEVKSVVRARGRRATKVKEEFIDQSHDTGASSPTRDLATQLAVSERILPRRTSTSASAAPPRRTPGRPRRSELPPSPADVADLAEYETARVVAGLDDLYSLSGIPDAIAHLRQMCSSVTGVQMTFLLIEAFALQRAVLPWNWIADLPSIPALGVPSLPLYIPDLFVLLTMDFWQPTLLWSATSLFLPMLVAYFYNLTIRQVKRHGATVSVAPRYNIDPVMFNVAKALATYVVYRDVPDLVVVVDQDGGHHPQQLTAVQVVKAAMPLGSQGILIGCYVTILMTVYEATLGRA